MSSLEELIGTVVAVPDLSDDSDDSDVDDGEETQGHSGERASPVVFQRAGRQQKFDADGDMEDDVAAHEDSSTAVRRDSQPLSSSMQDDTEHSSSETQNNAAALSLQSFLNSTRVELEPTPLDVGPRPLWESMLAGEHVDAEELVQSEVMIQAVKDFLNLSIPDQDNATQRNEEESDGSSSSRVSVEQNPCQGTFNAPGTTPSASQRPSQFAKTHTTVSGWAVIEGHTFTDDQVKVLDLRAEEAVLTTSHRGPERASDTTNLAGSRGFRLGQSRFGGEQTSLDISGKASASMDAKTTGPETTTPNQDDDDGNAADDDDVLWHHQRVAHKRAQQLRA